MLKVWREGKVVLVRAGTETVWLAWCCKGNLKPSVWEEKKMLQIGGQTWAYLYLQVQAKHECNCQSVDGRSWDSHGCQIDAMNQDQPIS